MKDHGLRPVTPQEITEFFVSHVHGKTHIDIAPEGEKVTVPEGWHGAGKTGDAVVTFDDLLTAPIAGTNLPAESFVSWLEALGFRFQVNGKESGVSAAAKVLESSELHVTAGEQPAFRAILSGAGASRIPKVIEVYSGAQSELMLQLSSVGNREKPGMMDKEAYRGAVANLMIPFLSQNEGADGKIWNVSDGWRTLRRKDDCLAGLTTVLGDMLVDGRMGVPTDHLVEELGVAIATTQAMTLAVAAAELRGVPLRIQAGAAAFGLAGKDRGLNYMVNTLPKAMARGYFTSGDLGILMKEDRPTISEPKTWQVGNGDARDENRFFLTGGSPVLRMMVDAKRENGAEHHGVVSVRRASRIHAEDGSNWGVVIDGIR